MSHLTPVTISLSLLDDTDRVSLVCLHWPGEPARLAAVLARALTRRNQWRGAAQLAALVLAEAMVENAGEAMEVTGRRVTAMTRGLAFGTEPAAGRPVLRVLPGARLLNYCAPSGEVLSQWAFEPFAALGSKGAARTFAASTALAEADADPHGEAAPDPSDRCLMRDVLAELDFTESAGAWAYEGTEGMDPFRESTLEGSMIRVPMPMGGTRLIRAVVVTLGSQRGRHVLAAYSDDPTKLRALFVKC